MLSKVKKIKEISSNKTKKYFFFLIIMMLLAMIFEMIGLSLIFPLIKQITSSEPNFILIQLHNLNLISSQILNSSPFKLTLFTSLIIFIAYATKAIISSLLEWHKAKFLYKLQEEISLKLFFSYIKSDYKRHLKENSSNLVRNIVTENQQFADNAIYPLLIFLTDLLVIIGILLILIIFEPIIVISCLISILVISYVYLKFTRKKNIKYGELRQKYEGLKIKFFNEGIGAVKELKILGSEKGFFSNFNRQNEGITHVGTRQSFIQVFPQIGLEFIAISGIVAVLLVISSRNLNLTEIIPLMGVIVAAIFRLIPAFYRMINCYVRIRFAAPVVDLMHSEILYKNEKNNTNQKDRFEFKDILSLKNINYSYYNSKYIFKDFNLDIPLNKWVAVKGETGSGKSTLIEIILGLLKTESGNILLNKKEVYIYENQNWLKNFSYVPQNIFLIDGTIKDNIIFDFDNSNFDKNKLNLSIEVSQLKEFINTLDLGLETIVGERGIKLSGGQKQRIGIARAIYNIKEIMIMDEATNALDEVTEKKLLKALKLNFYENSFIFISHRKETIDFCDHKIEIFKKGIGSEAIVRGISN